MRNSFFSGLSELIARVVSLVLVLVLFTVFYLAKDAEFRPRDLISYVVIISSGIILYELLSFVFYEIFSFFEQRAHASVHLATENQELPYPTELKDEKNEK